MLDDSETQPIPPTALILGGLGLLPFVVLALSQWFAWPFIPSQRGLASGMIYGAVILSFLGGIRWGVALRPSPRQSFDLSASVISSLIGWVALLLSPVVGLGLLISGFLLQALWDILSVEQGYLPNWYGKLRMLLTCGAVLALFSMLARIIVN